MLVTDDSFHSAVMSEDGLRAENAVVDAIDQGLIRPTRWAVARRLAEWLPDCDGLRDAALEAMLHGTADGRSRVAARLWDEVRELPFREGAKFRVLVGLTNGDGPLDFYEAGFLVQFADLAGVPREHITAAFGLVD